MNNRTITAGLLALLCTAAAAAEPTLPEKLTVGWLKGSDALAMMAYCAPDITPEKLEEMRRLGGQRTTVISRSHSATPYLVASGDRFACIDRQGPGKPVLPPAVFAKIIQMPGAPEAISSALHHGLAAQLAQRGAAEGLIRFSNGNAYEIVVNVVDDAPSELYYTANFVKAGEYDEARYRTVVSDPAIKSVSVSSYGPSGRRSLHLLTDELAPRPLRGEHLRIDGSAATAAMRFEDTAWDFSSGGTVRLAADHTVTYQPKQGNPVVGQWAVEDGALYFSYGKVFGSALVEGDKLSVEFRNPLAMPEKRERRWTATLSRGWY